MGRENGWDKVAIVEDHGFLVGQQVLVVFGAFSEVILQVMDSDLIVLSQRLW